MERHTHVAPSDPDGFEEFLVEKQRSVSATASMAASMHYSRRGDIFLVTVVDSFPPAYYLTGFLAVVLTGFAVWMQSLWLGVAALVPWGLTAAAVYLNTSTFVRFVIRRSYDGDIDVASAYQYIVGGSSGTA